MDTGRTASSGRRIAALEDAPGYVIGVLDSLLIALTREPPTVEAVRRIGEESRRLAKQYPEGVAVIIVPRAPRPALEAGVPRAIVRTWKDVEPNLYCGAVLLRTGGVVAAVQRGLVNTVIAMRRSALPVKLSTNPYDAAEWVTRHDPTRAATALSLGASVSAFVREHGPAA